MPLQSPSLASPSYVQKRRHRAAAARPNDSGGIRSVVSSPSLAGIRQSGAVDLSMCPSRATAVAPATAEASSTVTPRYIPSDAPWREAAHLPSETVAASLAGAAFHAAAGADVPAATASSAAIPAAHSPAVAYTLRHSSASAAGVAGSTLPAAASIPSLTSPSAPAGAVEGKDATPHTTLRWPSSPRSPGRATMIADPATVYFPAFAAWLSGLPARSACELLLRAALRSGKSADASFERCCSPSVAAAAQQQEQPGSLEAYFGEEEQPFQLPIDQQKQQQHQPRLVDFLGHNTAAAAAAAATPQFVRVQQPTAAPGQLTPEESTNFVYAELWSTSSRRQPRHHEKEETTHRLLQCAALTSTSSAAQVHPRQWGKPSLLQQDAHLLQHCPLRSDNRRRSSPLWRGATEESRAARRQMEPASGTSATQVKVSAGLLPQQNQQQLDEEGSTRSLQQHHGTAQLQQQQEHICASHAFCVQQAVQKSERHASKQLQRQTQQQFLRESQVHASPQRQCQQVQQMLNDNDQHRRQDQQSEKRGQKPRQEQQQREHEEEKRPRRRRGDTAGVGGGKGQHSREMALAEAAHVWGSCCGFRKQQQRGGVSVEQQGKQDIAAPCVRQREVRFTRQTRTLLQQLLLEKIQEQYLLFELLLTEGAFRLEPQQPPTWPPPPPAAAVALAAVLLLRGSEASPATLTESTPATAHIIPAAGSRGAARGAATAQGSGALAGGVVAEGYDFLQPAVWGVSHLCPCRISNAVAEAPIAAAAAAAEAAAFSAPSFRRSFQWHRMYSGAAASAVDRKAVLRGTAEDTRTTEAWRHAAARRTWSAVPRGPVSASAEGVSATQAPYSGEPALTSTRAGEHEGFSILARYQKAKARASEWEADIPRPVGCCVVLPPSVLHVLLRGYFSLDAAILLRLLLLPTSQQHLLVGDTCCCWLGGSAAAANAPERRGKGAAAGTSASRPFLAMSRMLAAFAGRRRHRKRTSLGFNLCCDIAAAAACGGVAVVRRQLENIQRVRRYVAAGALQQLLQPRRSYLRKVRSLFSAAAAANAAPATAPFPSAALQPAAAADDLPPSAAAPSSRAAAAGADPFAEHFSEGRMEVPAFVGQQSAAQPHSCIFCTQLPPCVSVAVAVHLLLPAFLGSRLGFLYWRICFILQHNLLLPPVVQAAGSGTTAATCGDSHEQAVAAAAAPARACSSASKFHLPPHFEGTATVGGPAAARDRAEASIQQSKGSRKKERIPTRRTETTGHGGPTAAAAAKTERRHENERWHLGIPHFYLRKSEKGTRSGRNMQVKENSRVPSAEQGRTSDTWRCPALCCFSCIDRLLLRLLQLLYGSSCSLRLHTRQCLPSTREELKQRPIEQREKRTMLLSGNGKAAPRGRGEEEGAEGGEVSGKAVAAGEISAAEVSVAPRRLTTAAAEEVAGGPVNTRGKPSATGFPVAAAAAASTEVSAAVLPDAIGDYREGQVSTQARAKGEARETAAAAAAAATLRLPQWCTLGSAAIQAKCSSLGASVATLRATARRSLVAATFSKKRTGSSVASGEKTKLHSQGGVQLLQQHVLFHLGRFREVTEQQRSNGHRSQMFSCFENSVPLFSTPTSGLTTDGCRLSRNTSAAAGLTVPSAAAACNIDPHTHAAAAYSCVPNALPVAGSFPASFGRRHLPSAGVSSLSRGDSPNSEDAAAAAAAERSTFVSASVCSSSKPLLVESAVSASAAQQAISATANLRGKTAGVTATDKEEIAADLELYLRAHATADREGSLRSRSSFGNATAAEVQSVCDTWESDMQKFQIGTSALFRSFYALLCCFSSAENFGCSLLHAWDLAVLLGSPRNTASATHCCCCSCCCSSVEYSDCSAAALGTSAAKQGEKQRGTAAQGGMAATHSIPPRLSRNDAVSLPFFDKEKPTSSSLHKLLPPAHAEGLEAARGRTAGGESILVLPATARGATTYEQKDGASATNTEDYSRDHRQRQQHVLESVYEQQEEDREQQQERWPQQQQQSLEDAGERRRPSGTELQLQGEADNIQQPNLYKRVQVQQLGTISHPKQKKNKTELPHHGRGKFLQQSDMAGEEQKQQRQKTNFEYWRRRREQLRLYFAACEVAFLELFASNRGRRRSRQGKVRAAATVSTKTRHLATGTGSLTQPEVCYDFSWSQSSSSNSSASESVYNGRCLTKRSRTQSSCGRRARNSRRKDCNSCRKHGNQRNSSDTVDDRAEDRRGRGSIRKEVQKGGTKRLLGNEGRNIRKPSFCAASSTPAAYAKARKLIRHCHLFALSLIDHPLQHCSRCGGSFAECKVDG